LKIFKISSKESVQMLN